MDRIKKWFYYRYFSLFFGDLPKWLELTGCEIPLQEYDELFKGVNGDIYIPLWTSVCKDGVLLNHTTLKVCEFYHRYGYSPVCMDGNPPDFIGEQMGFLAYLCSAGVGGEYDEALESFENLYLLDTIRTVAEGIITYAADHKFHTIARRMLDVSAGWVSRERAERLFNTHLSTPIGTEIITKETEIINTAGRNNCGGRCAVRAEVRAGCILGLSTEDPLRACLRGRGYRRTFLSGERLRYPMKRIGERGEGRFARISWDEAADITAAEWRRIKDAHGVGSRYVNYSTGVCAALRPDHFAKRLLNLDGGFLDWYNSYSSACGRYITPYIYGDVYSGNSMEDILNSKLLILWGHNPAETIFGTPRNGYITEAKARGLRIIVIDPRQSDSAIAYADKWIGIKPSTDSALADAMAYVIWSEGLHDKGFMDKFCLGFDGCHMPEGIGGEQSYEAYLFGQQDGIEKTPQWAEAITGIPAETIMSLAQEYALTKPACLLQGLGVQRIGNGEQTTRSLALLTCLTGNVGIPGGGAAGVGEVPGPVAKFPTLPNPFPGKIPSFLWTKALERAGEMTLEEDGLEGVERLNSNIKMIINLAGNTLINQHSDINNTIRILKDSSKCEFILCSDIFMTPSARFADILLPATSFLEGDNIVNPWDFGSYTLYNNKVIEPLFGCRFEYDFLTQVAKRLGLPWEESYSRTLENIYEDMRRAEPELPEFSVFKSNGGHHYKNVSTYIAYSEQIFEGRPFKTPSGKIEIFSPRLARGKIPAIPKYVPCPEGPDDPLALKYPIQLIGWHTKSRTHSIHANNDWLKEAEPQRLWIHPEDAKARGIGDNDLVEVFNDRGRVRIPAHVTRRIIKGVAAMPQGAWYKPNASGVDIGGSINVLTSTCPTPLAKGNPQHTNLVEIRRYE